MPRRRKPDLWEHVRDGDIVSFSWCGKRHPHIRIDFPVTQPVWFYFDGNVGDVIVRLHGAPVIHPEPGERYQPRTRAMRLVDGALAHLDLGEPVHNLDGELVISSGEPEVYEDFFDAAPGLRERLTAIAQWMSDHRVELSDPQVALRS